ncbi:MAG TPA: flagellar basal body L-ring protein FlgH [Acidobacteriota bacterium]|nr:flagellar basal body L-ring protein FlgH [Acidobacteriota bacterium]
MKYAAYGFVPFMFAALVSTGCGPTQAKVADPTELQTYVESANKVKTETGKSEGSLWTNHGYRSNLFRDSKARNIDDVVTINVSESTQAVSTADAKNTKSTSMTAGMDHLFGLEKKINELPNMVSGKSDSSFAGQGSTSRQTTLATSLTARVINVLPNGYLVVEGMREIRVNNENQSVYLTGVVRPEDISASNTVLSSAVAQMSVRVQGKGVVSQPLKPGWLYKILNGILPF